MIVVGQYPGLDNKELAISCMSCFTKTMGIREADGEVGRWMGLTLDCVYRRNLMLALLKLRILLSEDRLVKLANLLVNKTQEAMYCV